MNRLVSSDHTNCIFSRPTSFFQKKTVERVSLEKNISIAQWSGVDEVANLDKVIYIICICTSPDRT